MNHYGPDSNLALVGEIRRLRDYTKLPLPEHDREARLLALDDRMGRVTAWLRYLVDDVLADDLINASDVEEWLMKRLEGPDRPGACVTVNLTAFRVAFGLLVTA